LNTVSESVPPIIHRVLEQLQRDYALNLPDLRNHLAFRDELLSFEAALQVTEQEKVPQCEAE
jgi:hypothetical protein